MTARSARAADRTQLMIARIDRRTGQPERPRVLFVVNVAWFFLSHRLPLALAARDAGYDVHVAADVEDPAEAEAVRAHGFAFHRVALERGSVNPLHELRYALRLLRVIRDAAPTLVHNVTIKPVLYGTLAARILRVAGIVNAVSGLGYSFSGESRRPLAVLVKLAYRCVLRSSRVKVIFQNGDDARQVAAAARLKPDQCVLIKGSGVDLRSFAPSAEPEPPVRVVLPSRMLRDKGILEFAEAAQALRAQGCDARFLLAGRLDPSNPAAIGAEELRAVCARSGVEWLGHVSDVPELLRQCHVVCLPSYREGLPKALIEACAAARPIVTTDVPGCRDVVTHGVNGYLVPPRSGPQLAEALRALIEDPRSRAAFGRAGRLKAETEFAVESVVEKTLSLYRQIVECA